MRGRMVGAAAARSAGTAAADLPASAEILAGLVSPDAIDRPRARRASRSSGSKGEPANAALRLAGFVMRGVRRLTDRKRSCPFFGAAAAEAHPRTAWSWRNNHL